MGQYLTPAGCPIQGIGLVPDVVVPAMRTADTDRQYATAVNLLVRRLELSLRIDTSSRYP
ncbi:hypothetical protein [Gloeobacter violaceus]|uniref:hypothetical protein n=1 Tax=Gloeobacter violaceus TaxID=33072 RepID=UPI000300A1F3|nr:hypothetical protein [Gloeobacter violaceus]